MMNRDAQITGNIMGDFWVIVNNILTSPVAYVLVPSEVKQFAHRGEKDGRISYWPQPSSYCLDDFRDAWNRTGEPQ